MDRRRRLTMAKKQATKGGKKGAKVTAKGAAAGGELRSAAGEAQPRVSGGVLRPGKGGGVKGARVRGGQAPGAGQKAASATPVAEAGTTARERDPRLPAVGTVLVKRDRDGRARCECTV